MNSSQNAFSGAYLVDDQFHFSLYGRWDRGGFVEISHGGAVVEMLRLSKAPWALFAILALRAKAALGVSRVAAFMTPDELVRELRKRTRTRLFCTVA